MTPGHEWPWVWGATPQEVGARYPCADQPVPHRVSVFRAVSVAAPVDLTWRWLCMLKRAPYSYDLLDNLGRRSPRTLDPTATPMAVGDTAVMIFACVDAVEGQDWTGTVLPLPERMFGPMATTYRVRPMGTGASRLICRLDFASTPGGPGASGRVLAAGDLVMMRKQLLTLKKYAERDAVNSDRPTAP